MSAADLQLRLDAVRRRVDAARTAADAGEAVDLSPLTEEVQAVCEALRAAPLQIDRAAAARDIEGIVGALDELEQALRARALEDD